MNRGDTLKEKTAKGLFWGGMNNAFLQLVGVVFGIMLGRLLDTSDYGMMAMISVFSLVATALQDSGFKTALANETAPTDRDYNSVFWFNILMGAALYGVLFLCAPLIGRFYGQPSVAPLCRYAFLSIVLASLGTAQSAWLFKNLRARQQAKASMAAVLLSNVVGVAMAFAGMRYWSLATQGLVYVLVNTLLQWHYSEWRPTWQVDFAPVRRMFRFSCKILATTIALHVNNNVLNILLARFFGRGTAGVYNQAWQWNFKSFSLVQGMVNQVAQPVLVDLRGDGERQLRALRKMVRFSAFLSFPLLLGLALVAHEFIVLTIGQKWLPSVDLLRWLCVGGAVMPISTLLSNLVVSRGRSGQYLAATCLLCVVQIGLMLLLHPHGIRTMVIAAVLLQWTWVGVWWWLAHRLTGYALWALLADIAPFALTAAGVMAVTHLGTSWLGSLCFLLAVRVVMAALLYATAMWLARVQIFRECLAFLRHRDGSAGKA